MHRNFTLVFVAALLAGCFSSAQVLTPERERALKQGDTFKECRQCPEMIVVPPGSFIMGSAENEPGRFNTEGPRHQVTFARQFAVGKFSVTFDEWEACMAARGCNASPPLDQNWGRGRRPVINVSWNDAKDYVTWLSKITGKTYRLLSEAEREYVTRAGTTTPFWWGSSISIKHANYNGHSYSDEPEGSFRRQTLPVGSFAPNHWGLYDVHGNVWEWTEDCYKDSYDGAPTDGSAVTDGDCTHRVERGGAWANDPGRLRSASRGWDNFEYRLMPYTGFRVARVLISPEPSWEK